MTIGALIGLPVDRTVTTGRIVGTGAGPRRGGVDETKSTTWPAGTIIGSAVRVAVDLVAGEGGRGIIDWTHATGLGDTIEGNVAEGVRAGRRRLEDPASGPWQTLQLSIPALPTKYQSSAAVLAGPIGRSRPA